MTGRIYARNTLSSPKLIAHRGYAVQLPQNSLSAFRRAGELGFWAIETDVHATRDGVLVCCHNDTVDGQYSGSGKIADFTWEELSRLRRLQAPQERMPLFSEYLEICRASGSLPFIEIKTAAPEQVLQAALEKFPVEDIILSCIQLEPLLQARRACPGVFLHHIFTTPEKLCRLTALGRCGVSFRVASLTDAPAGLIEWTHEQGALICLRAGDTPEAVRGMVAAGLDYIPTNCVTWEQVRS